MASTHIIIALLLPVVIMPIVAFLTTRPRGIYHCHVPGCCKTFESTENFINHMRFEHDYTGEMIIHMLKEIKRYR